MSGHETAKQKELNLVNRENEKENLVWVFFILSETAITSVLTTTLFEIQWELLLPWQSVLIIIFCINSDVKWRIYNIFKLLGECFRINFLIIYFKTEIFKLSLSSTLTNALKCWLLIIRNSLKFGTK